VKGDHRASVFTSAGSWRLIPVATLMVSLEFLFIGVNILQAATLVWEQIGGAALIAFGLLLGSLSVIVFVPDDD